MLKKLCFSLILSSTLVVGFSQLTMAQSPGTRAVDCRAYADQRHDPSSEEWLETYEWCLCHFNYLCF